MASVLEAKSNAQLALELREWARARGHCNARRTAQGKDPLDSDLLLLAAARIEAIGEPDRLLVDPNETVHVRQVARNCAAQAKARWGKAWDLLSPVEQRNAVAAEVVSIVLAQSKQYDDTLRFLQGVAAFAYNMIDL